MKNDVAIGANRTGIALSPIDSKAMMDTAGFTVSTAGDETALHDARAEYLGKGDVIGSMPPPASAKGVATTGLAAIKGMNANVLVDKLGERLAFERTGTRLYGALVDKCLVSPPLPSGPSIDDLRQIQAEELAHFQLVREAIVAFGGDPTAVTPSADVQAVASSGLLQVVTDPRMTLKQSLEAMLVAELVDNDCWPTLVALVRDAGREDLVAKFEEVIAAEAEHLRKVRSWVKAATLAKASRDA